METRTIQLPEELRQAKEFMIRVFHEADDLGYSSKGAASFEDFVNRYTDQLVFIGTYDDTLAGVLAYDKEKWHLALLFTETLRQRQGIATSLFNEMKNRAEKECVSVISVHAAKTAVPFYQALGFEKEGEMESAGDISYCSMEYLLQKEWLGKTVSVTVEHAFGSLHPLYPDAEYEMNAGYVEEVMKKYGEFQDAYVYDVDEPVDDFRGVVIAIIYRKNMLRSCWVVARSGQLIDHMKVKQAAAFIEQHYDTRFVFADDEKIRFH